MRSMSSGSARRPLLIFVTFASNSARRNSGHVANEGFGPPAPTLLISPNVSNSTRWRDATRRQVCLNMEHNWASGISIACSNKLTPSARHMTSTSWGVRWCQSYSSTRTTRALRRVCEQVTHNFVGQHLLLGPVVDLHDEVAARESNIHVPWIDLLDVGGPRHWKAESCQQRRNFSRMDLRVSLRVLLPYFLLIFFGICKGTNFSR